MTLSSSTRTTERIPDLTYKPGIARNLGSRFLTLLAGLFSLIAVLPLVLVLGYVLLKGASKINIGLLTELPPPPGLEGGGIGNAIIGKSLSAYFEILLGIEQIKMAGHLCNSISITYLKAGVSCTSFFGSNKNHTISAS